MPTDDDRFDDRFDDRRDDAPPDDDEIIRKAQDAVKAPAIGLIVTAVISLVLLPLGVVQYFMLPAQFEQARKDIETKNPNMTADQKKGFNDFLNVYESGVKVALPLTWVITTATSVLTLLAGLRLKNLTSPGLVKGGAIVSMIPCLSGCCLLGLVFGILTLTSLGKPEVKAGFAAMKRRTGA
jgi:hypothetical protein